MGAPSLTQLETRADRPAATVSRTTSRRRGGAGDLGILVSGLIAVVTALLMPFAPVSMSTPTVSWPQNPLQPVSTELQLSAQVPQSIAATFSCAAVDAARGSADGVLLSTTRSGRLSEADGLLVRVQDDVLTVSSNGAQLYSGTVPGGACGYDLRLTDSSTTLLLDGRPLVDEATAHLPEVDVLATSVSALPAGATDADLSVSVAVDDHWSTSPTPLKWAITLVLLVSSMTCLALMFRRERLRRRQDRQDRREGAGPTGPARWLRHVSVVDVAVAVLLLAWLFLAPMTDDDGYYAAMARNSVVNGYVGNYYQLFNQGYTPFTWFYQLLGYWDLLGHSPVLLRIPSMIGGLLTYAVARSIVGSLGFAPARTRLLRLARPAVVAIVFCAAWLPYSMGVRPESMVALLATLAFGAVVLARKRQSLAWFSVALVIGGLALTCHPTGVVAFAAPIVSLPVIWPLVRASSLWRTLIRVLGVIAPAAISAIPAFVDGTLYDFLSSQAIYADKWPQTQWYDEIVRYEFLLGDGPMGAYAKRAIVLVGLVLLGWFLVLQLSAAGRRTRSWPPLMVLAGYSYGLALLLLWITPSKWTHHFGSISGLSTIFISGCLIGGARMVVAAQRGRRSPAPAVVLAAVSLVLAFALAWHGPNTWAYSWMIGMPQAFERPHVGRFGLGSPAPWLAVVIVVALVVALRLRRSRLDVARIAGRAAPVAIVLFLLSMLAYLVGGFAYATVANASTYSPSSDALRDPLARNCAAEGAIAATDPATASVLPAGPTGDAATTGFSPNGYLPSAPPPDGAAGALPVWGSYPGLGMESNTGQLTTGWYVLPAAQADQKLIVEASGRLDNGNTLVAEYGRAENGAVTEVDRQTVDDGADSPTWRQLALQPPSGAELVRLSATDGSVGSGGWLAVSEPVTVRSSLLTEQIPAGDHVYVAWQLSFLFPCANLPPSVHGITQPSDYLVGYGDHGLSGLDDATFSRDRAGLINPTIRSSTLVKLDATMVDHPDVTTFQVYEVENPYASQAYVLKTDREVRWGWQGV